MIQLDVPKKSFLDLKQVMSVKLSDRIIWTPFHSSSTKTNIRSTLGPSNKIATKKSKPKHYNLLLSILPPKDVKEQLAGLMGHKKPYAIYMRWFQLGTAYVQNILQTHKVLYVVQPNDGKLLQKGGDIVRVASNFVWITNIPCKSKGNVVVYKMIK